MEADYNEASITCFTLQSIVNGDDVVEGTETFFVELMESHPPVNTSGNITVDIIDEDGMHVKHSSEN